MTHEHTKEFNLMYAKAGAPVGTADGCDVEPLRWLADTMVGIVTTEAGAQYPGEWDESGEYVSTPMGRERMRLVMLPLGECEGKPVFSGDTLCDYSYDSSSGDSSFMVSALAREFGRYGWPRVDDGYPKTTLSPDDLLQIFSDGPSGHRGAGLSCECVANAALKHAVETGQLVPAEMLRKVARKIVERCEDAATATMRGRVFGGGAGSSIGAGASGGAGGGGGAMQKVSIGFTVPIESIIADVKAGKS